jgi:hypothetical protein
LVPRLLAIALMAFSPVISEPSMVTCLCSVIHAKAKLGEFMEDFEKIRLTATVTGAG